MINSMQQHLINLKNYFPKSIITIGKIFHTLNRIKDYFGMRSLRTENLFHKFFILGVLGPINLATPLDLVILMTMLYSGNLDMITLIPKFFVIFHILGLIVLILFFSYVELNIIFFHTGMPRHFIIFHTWLGVTSNM